MEAKRLYAYHQGMALAKELWDVDPDYALLFRNGMSDQISMLQKARRDHDIKVQRDQEDRGFSGTVPVSE